jgi:Na+-transporting NADH:ubiquinone oxidoreductase subunit A
MSLINIKKGLILPITGEPEPKVYPAAPVTLVALLGQDYPGMKPTLAVRVGDRVKLGQVLFADKKMPKIQYTSPGSGKVIAINRGEKRLFLSIIIELKGEDAIVFKTFTKNKIAALSRQHIISLLLESGLWTALRMRPFGKVANPDDEPHSLFITAMDTNPLAPCMETIVNRRPEEFTAGLEILSKLTGGTLYLCQAAGARIPSIDNKQLSITEFAGPHPAGLVGTHIHFLDPVDRHKTVWTIGAQDVIAVGHLFSTGQLSMERVVSLAGPSVKKPRLIETRLGAHVPELTKGELLPGENRLISGSVLSGRTAADAVAFLGRYHQQISVIREDRERVFLGWLSPGMNLYSIKNIVLSKLYRNKKFNFTTNLNGALRSIVPIGSYEKVMPLDILPTHLLRALAVTDVESAENLGCLELEEEDLALCTFVCPCKVEHGENLRKTLNLIEKEG